MNNTIAMESETQLHSTVDVPTETDTSINDTIVAEDPDNTIHGFNASGANETVIEKSNKELLVDLVKCEGSDSGVEVVEGQENCGYQRTLSSNSGNSHDFDTVLPRSCDSSIISCCSNYDEAFNLLVRKNSTLLEDYSRNGDVTSENGSESSSISGTTSRNKRILLNSAKKKVSVAEAKTKSALAKERSRSKPPQTPKNTTQPARLKSLDRLQGRSSTTNTPKPNNSTTTRTKLTPTTLDLNTSSKRPSSGRSSSSTRTPQLTPSDDGRWPSVYSKPAPLMCKSLRGNLEGKPKAPTQMESKTIEKYATLPRRKKEKSAETIPKKTNSRESSTNRLAVTKKQSSRETTPSKYSSIYTNKVKQKVKIYHETSIQTALTMADVEKALNGETVCYKDPREIEKVSQGVQVDISRKEFEKLEEKLKSMTEKYETLQGDYKTQTGKLEETEAKLKEEEVDKEGIKKELENNTQRVLALLGTDNNPDIPSTSNSDSLLVLENRFQNVSHVVIRQEEEIARLNSYTRSLQIELDKCLNVQKNLLLQQQELQAESIELQDFMQAEKQMVSDALKDAENEINRLKEVVHQREKEVQDKQDESNHLVRLCEERKQDMLTLQGRLNSIESKSRELLVQQGSSVSGAAVALAALIARLEGLVEELVAAYSISDQELDDVIFHNETYNSSSSPESTPEKSRKNFTDKSPSPKNGSSFVSAVINAIKNAAAQTPFSSYRDASKDNLCTDHSSSNEMLDSETEPCLMMEHVLEDVVMPDNHTHNMVSSGCSLLSSRLTQSESLKDLSQAILNRQQYEQASMSYHGSLNTSFTSEPASIDVFPSTSLVDQVIEVDNVITRLLKVIRIIQLETDDSMTELQDNRDSLAEQVEKQQETNKVVVKQLKDWEILGSRLKSEVKELMAQLWRKNTEMDKLKSELNYQREQVEKLNQDVCELSTALSKAELETRIKEEEVAEEIKKCEETGKTPSAEVLGRLVATQNEIPLLKEKLADKEKRLNDVRKEFLESRQVLTESLKNAVKEVKKQYDAIDKALEVLNKNQAIIQQYPPLAQLQRELEDTSFQTASAMPIVAPSDCNANAALLQAVGNLEIAPPINTTA
ncbi:unnamed protein product [Brassicogethes aeneus]|uniref:Uncharacterized protein n=1 Tax=Brassicogethes aeneus TaxID=1431903 RepID=A0A9P0B4T1_BRAAE|nr:unnamed protein product [Brassicogethes aeneus]